jgi:putative mRNA 3-end processing factor
LRDLGVQAVRRQNSRGSPAPHLSLKFDSHLFSIDTSRSPKHSIQPDAYLITHAHSDHYGKSAMLSERAIASVETARALEIRHGKKYKGRTFRVGESIHVGDVEIETHPTGHTIGSAAFSWKNSLGTKILVTGDVKDYRTLPGATSWSQRPTMETHGTLGASSTMTWQASLRRSNPAPPSGHMPLERPRGLWL